MDDITPLLMAKEQEGDLNGKEGDEEALRGS